MHDRQLRRGKKNLWLINRTIQREKVSTIKLKVVQGIVRRFLQRYQENLLGKKGKVLLAQKKQVQEKMEQERKEKERLRQQQQQRGKLNANQKRTRYSISMKHGACSQIMKTKEAKQSGNQASATKMTINNQNITQKQSGLLPPEDSFSHLSLSGLPSYTNNSTKKVMVMPHSSNPSVLSQIGDTPEKTPLNISINTATSYLPQPPKESTSTKQLAKIQQKEAQVWASTSLS